jgi:hypothetical protein
MVNLRQLSHENVVGIGIDHKGNVDMFDTDSDTDSDPDKNISGAIKA